MRAHRGVTVTVSIVLPSRAYTLFELVAVVVVVSLLALLASMALSTPDTMSRQARAEVALDGLRAAQMLRYDTFGQFSSDPSTLQDMLAGYSFVANTAASSSPNEISVVVSTADGLDVFAAAVITDRGVCYTVKSFEPSSSTPDVSLVHTALDPASCTGSYALSASTGGSW